MRSRQRRLRSAQSASALGRSSRAGRRPRRRARLLPRSHRCAPLTMLHHMLPSFQGSDSGQQGAACKFPRFEGLGESV